MKRIRRMLAQQTAGEYCGLHRRSTRLRDFEITQQEE